VGIVAVKVTNTRTNSRQSVDDKLHKTVLLMLRATLPGEIAAARDALLRLAKEGKRDAHALADVLAKALTVRARTTNGEDLSTRDMAIFIWKMHERGVHLSEKEAQFVDDMIDWHRPTQKQADWLKSIYARVKRVSP
jgi:hypothetical protein